MSKQAYFLAQDQSSHWYVVMECKRAEWDVWCEIDEDDEAAWDVPGYANRIGGSPSSVVFHDWKAR